ncbi:nicotinate-nucleotide adenylyltransferase [Marinobacter salinexigens]|uniref:Probable nicotinate-nucleotide adenylyltransferase n=1 Tax=Marinobacter salinexigens TaxID=2919747 RepID=A0A5B0VGG9_9GAMM|nr:nicotinate-nucleotide adenylyltransferase [Marinobacter salinexigens]KAA1173159.1 nicotinate-nucleotide adenylyltransferase [Marinobacter salinexigens]
MHVIYGGTFDPIHHGHLRLALELSDRLGVPRIHLVPCHIPPHRGETGASSAQRLRLLELAIAGESQLAIDSRELDRAGASYTADTLRQLRREVGEDEPLVMVVGTDAFAGFDRWRDWQQIPGLAHIVVVRRPGPPLDPSGKPARLLAERAAEDVSALYGKPGGLILELDPPLLDISATGIRERIGEGRSPRYLIPDPVWDEIRRMGLYGACPDDNF